MQTYIALLRGINVSGHKKILMADLKDLFKEIGLQNTQTYIQSGNVVFDAAETDVVACARMVEEKIKTVYGFEVPTLVIRPEELKSIIAATIFKDEALLKSYFTLLYTIPQQDKKEALAAYAFPKETFALTDTCIYSYPENGAGRAKATNNFFEKKLGVIGTSRNYKTMIKLAEMAG